MTDLKLPSLPELTNPADADLLYVVDVSDPTENATGTSKKVTVVNLSSGLLSLAAKLADANTFIATNTFTADNALILPQFNDALTPTLAFGDGDTGLYESVDDSLVIVASSVLVARLIAVAGVSQFIVPLQNNAALPSIAFGDGDSGFFESADDVIAVSIAAVDRFVFSANTFRGEVANSPSILNESATATNPVHSFFGDSNTGIGLAAADQLSLIAGAVEGIRITEAGSAITDIALNGPVSSPNASAAEVGFRGSPVNGKTANYTLELGDAARTVGFSGSTVSQTFTIPANASVAFPIGTMIGIDNSGSVSISIAITTDVLTWGKDNTTGTRTLAAGGSAVIQKISATGWKINGSALLT